MGMRNRIVGGWKERNHEGKRWENVQKNRKKREILQKMVRKEDK